MTYIITTSELENMSELELRSKLFSLAQELHRIEQQDHERTAVLAAIECVQRALMRRKPKGPRF